MADDVTLVRSDGTAVFGGTMVPPTGTPSGDSLQATGVDGAPAQWAAGGGSVPDSWISCFVNTPLTASGNYSFGLNAVVGDDLAIDEDADFKIEVLNDGTYVVMIPIDVSGDADGAGSVTAHLQDDDGQDWLAGGIKPMAQFNVVAPNYSETQTITSPPLKLAAGDYLYCPIVIGTSAGAITVGQTGGMVVKRTA